MSESRFYRRWQCFDVRTNTSGIDDKGGAKLLLTTQQTKRDWIQQESEEPHNEPAKWFARCASCCEAPAKWSRTNKLKTLQKSNVTQGEHGEHGEHLGCDTSQKANSIYSLHLFAAVTRPKSTWNSGAALHE